MRLWPRQEALEEALAQALTAGQAVSLGGRESTWERFVSDLVDRAGLRPIDAVTERLALREACRRVAAAGERDRERGVATSRGVVAASARFVAEVQRAGLAGAALVRTLANHDVGPEGDALAHARLERLARVLAAFDALAAPLGGTRAGAVAEVRRRLAAAAPATPAAPAAAAGSPLHLYVRAQAGELQVQARLGWEPADIELVQALAAHVVVRVTVVHAGGRAIIDAGVDPVLRAFEAKADVPGLELDPVLVDDVAASAFAPLVAALHAGDATTAPPAGLAVVSAPTELAELRAIAAHARALVDAGTPPERIAVAARTPDAIAVPLTEALARVGLSADARRGEAVAGAPLWRLVRQILALPERGLAREDVLAVLGSRWTLEVPGLAVAARAAGVRELGARGRDRLRTAARGGDDLAERTAQALAAVERLPAEATTAAHARALGAALEALDVPRRARAVDPRPDDDAAGSDDDPLGRRLTRALARDQAAMDAIEALLAALPAAAARLGLATAPLTRAAFAALLEDLAADTPLPRRGARGGSVRLVALAELPARRFAQVYVPGLVEGAAPARGGDDGVWGERERRALNRAVGARVVSTSPAGDDGEAERTPWETLMLAGALAAADDGVWLSWPRAAGGRATVRSPFVDEVLRAAPDLAVQVLAAAPLPAAADALAPIDLLARVALERFAEPSLRLPGAADPVGGAALHAVAAARFGPRLARVAALAKIERERWAFFAAAGRAAPGAFVGGAGAQPGLAARAGGDAARPIPAGALEKLARCGYTFFAARVLGVGELDEGGDAPDPRDLGRLAHAVLERFYRGLAEAGALPVSADAGTRAALDEATDAVFEELAGRAAGHPTLWSIARARLRDDLWRLVAFEAREGAPGGGTPTFFELQFDAGDKPGMLAPLALGQGDDIVHVSGRIDRVDLVREPAGVVVLDYKLGRLGGQKNKLADRAIGRTELQLPVYILAAQRGLVATGRLPADAVAMGAFISLKDGAPTQVLGERAEKKGKRASQGPGLDEVLGERLPALGAAKARDLRDGRFAVAPARDACKRCDYRTTCRVVVLEEEEDT